MVEKVKDVQVIEVETGKWAVTVSGDPSSFQVEDVAGELTCPCIHGMSGKFCQHKRAVSAKVEAQKMNTERALSGEPGPVPPKKDAARSKITKHGYLFGEVTSALQKSIRRSDEREAVYWLLELYESAPYYVAKRLCVIASEDVGMAAPETVAQVNAIISAWNDAKKFSWFLSPHQLTQVVVMLCRAPKSTEIEDLQAVTFLDFDERRRQIPKDAIDMHTAQGKELAKAQGKDYDTQCIDWYQGRIDAGIPLNQNTKELFSRRPQWAPDGWEEM